MGVTYEQLTGDLSGVNYSSIRAGRLTVGPRASAQPTYCFNPRVKYPAWRR